MLCDKDTKVPIRDTNGTSRNLVIQSFLSRIDKRYPPFCVEGRLVGPNAQETWESVAAQKNLEVYRFFAYIPNDSIEDMETVNE